MAGNRLTIALGIGKKKPMGEEGPPPSRFKKPTESAPPQEAPLPETPVEDPAASPLGMEPEGDEGGIGPIDVDYSDNDLCETCANMGQDGNCTKYGFPVQPSGHCAGGYMPKGEEVPRETGTMSEGTTGYPQGDRI